jgi:2-oxoglutarate ferredoxin oxidoreductase subunit beta
LDHPFNPVALALGAEASFVARTIDNDRHHLTEVLRHAATHRGAAFIEIYQNCNVFNDGAFDALRDKQHGAQQNQIRLEDGKPVLFDEGRRCVRVGENGRLEIAESDSTPGDQIVVHDAHQDDPTLAFQLAHLSTGPTQPTCIGVFRDTARPVYGEAMEAQIEQATERLGRGDLAKLLLSGDTWVVK